MGLLEVKHGLLQIAESLDFLHNHAHLIHRAISPENVFITLSGAWKLGGFGFAISASQNSGDSCNLPAFHYDESILSLMKQITAGDSKADGISNPAHIAAMEKSLLLHCTFWHARDKLAIRCIEERTESY